MSNKILAEWWWCGDEECNCWQPTIRVRNQVGILVDELDTGPFHSGPEPDEWDEMFVWMEMKCKQRGIEMPEAPIERYWRDKEA